jgi:hypothetical protein
MLLQQLDITNSRGNVLSLQMQQDDSSYQIASIEGLDPGKAVLVATSSAGQDGETYQSAKRPARNIKLKLDFDPDFALKSYSELRSDLYSWFMPKSRITMRFFLSTGLYVDIDGVVESMDSPLFEQDPDANISIMCFQPDFVDGRLASVPGFTVADSTNTPIVYPGTVEAGTVVTINLNRAASGLSIYNSDEAGNLQQLDFSGALLNGDKLVISSLAGNKGITLTRAGASSSFLYGRSSQSSWINLVEGVNQFRVYAVGDPIPYTLEYAVRYGGL